MEINLIVSIWTFKGRNGVSVRYFMHHKTSLLLAQFRIEQNVYLHLSKILLSNCLHQKYKYQDLSFDFFIAQYNLTLFRDRVYEPMNVIIREMYFLNGFCWESKRYQGKRSSIGILIIHQSS